MNNTKNLFQSSSIEEKDSMLLDNYGYLQKNQHMESHSSSRGQNSNIFNAYMNNVNKSNSPIRLDGNLLPNSTIDHELDDIEDVILDDSPLISNRRRDDE